MSSMPDLMYPNTMAQTVLMIPSTVVNNSKSCHVVAPFNAATVFFPASPFTASPCSCW